VSRYRLERFGVFGPAIGAQVSIVHAGIMPGRNATWLAHLRHEGLVARYPAGRGERTGTVAIRRISFYALVFLVAGFLAGCGGGGNASPSPTMRSGPGTANVTLRIDVPLTDTASTRRPAYVSPATQSLAILVETSPGGAQVGFFSVNVTPSSPSCQTVTVNGLPTLTCTLAVPLALPSSGTYELATTTYDQAQTQQCSPSGTPACAGNVLSASLMTAALQVNAANTISIALGGLATSFTVTPVANGFVSGSVAGLNMWGPQAQTLVVTARDADGYTIAGAGAPTLSLTSASPNVQITSSTPGAFTVQAATSGAPAVVTPGTISLTATATPVNSPATPFTQTISLTIQHTAVFVSNGGSVAAYFDGNATPSIASLMNTNSPRGIAVDANGMVYIGNHASPGTVTACSAGNAWSTCALVINAGTPNNEGVAIDGSGDLWLTANGSELIEYPPGANPPNPILDISTGMSTLRGVAFDSNGNLWAANQNPTTLAGYAPPFSAGSTPFATLATAGVNAPIQLATDAAGNLWVANCGSGCPGGSATSTVTEFAPVIGSASTPAVTLSSGITQAEGVAVDATGVVWIADQGSGRVIRCAPPGFSACTWFAVPSALWIAAYPAAFDP
jgi:hypothetical protein